jgi:hypothetical protein
MLQNTVSVRGRIISLKDWVFKSQFYKVSHLRKICKFNKLFKSANLQICDVRNFFADRPPMVFNICLAAQIILHAQP